MIKDRHTKNANKVDKVHKEHHLLIVHSEIATKF